jgi:hypothetical protein
LLKLLKKEQIGAATSSRIFHRIANIKKGLNKERTTIKNAFEVEVDVDYSYESLSDEQLDEVVKL